MGSKQIGFACLQQLLSFSEEIEVVAVFSKKNQLDSPEKNVSFLAEEKNIPLFDELQQLESLPAADWILSVQYHQILRSKHLQKAKEMAINLHMAPVPEYRGCNQFSFAIFNEEKTFGTTLHLMDESIDGGAILFEKRFPIPEKCWVQELYQLTESNSILLFNESLPKLLKGDFTAKPQSVFEERKKGFYQRKDIQQLKQIDLNEDAATIERQVRATFFPPFEPPFAMIDGKKMYFTNRHDNEHPF